MADGNGIKFYRCNTCGNLMFAIVDSGVNPDCCGVGMELLESKKGGEFMEKHLPVVQRSGDKVLVRVGSELHPMEVEHRIEWIALIDGKRIDFQRMTLKGEPVADFTIREGKEMLRVYAYCSSHGLWESEAWI